MKGCLPDENTVKPKICLNMIVKNESKVIRRCLESVKPLIDYWVIADTGSTDGTQKTIKNTLKEIPGELHEHPWKNFAHNRNRALALTKHKGDYVLFIDADETFVYNEHYRFPKLDNDYYFFKVQNERSGQMVSEYKRILLIDNRLDWKWEGPIHEVISSPQATKYGTMGGIVNISRTEEGHRFQDPQKYLNDAKVLEQALEEEPNNTRYVFHLALSYYLANDYAPALKNFQKRISMQPSGTESNELFLSFQCSGNIQAELKMGSDAIIDSFTKAHFCRPLRAEPLYYLGNYFLSQGSYLLADLVLKKALMLPFPSEVYLVENWIYAWGVLYKVAECTFKMGRFQESVTAIHELLSTPGLPQHIDRDLRASLKSLNACK